MGVDEMGSRRSGNKPMGHTASPAMKASLVTLLTWQKEPATNIVILKI